MTTGSGVTGRETRGKGRFDYNDRRLLIVSNRLPVSIKANNVQEPKIKLSDGGLVTALEPVLRHRGGVWIGWAGSCEGDADDLTALLKKDGAVDGFSLVPVTLTREDVEEFYEGFSNQVIWPLFHDQFNHCDFDPRYWDAYRRVNRKFASVVAGVIDAEDIVWVHDYHLMSLGAELRAVGVGNPLGFFNHIPFPSPDIFRRLPWRDRILDDLQAFDLIGFQTRDDEEHFHASLTPSQSRQARRRRWHSGSLDRSAAAQRKAGTGHFGISIDYDSFHGTAGTEAVADQARQLKRDIGDRIVLLGVDRLDYSKGLQAKLSAFRYALQQHPELCEQVTLVQYVVPSRQNVPEYNALQEKLERTVGAINGELSRPAWIPIHYCFGTLERDQLCAYYRMANVCLVTSLKDGMNLISKEYCACQVDDPGVLILSEFTGAAIELWDDVLIVNPYNVKETAAAIYRACTMPLAERTQRMRRLNEKIRRNDVLHWVDNFVEALQDASERVFAEEEFERPKPGAEAGAATRSGRVGTSTSSG